MSSNMYQGQRCVDTHQCTNAYTVSYHSHPSPHPCVALSHQLILTNFKSDQCKLVIKSCLFHAALLTASVQVFVHGICNETKETSRGLKPTSFLTSTTTTGSSTASCADLVMALVQVFSPKTAPIMQM